MLDQIIAKIKGQFEKDSSGHDWFHIQRVYDTACYLQSKEGGDLEVVQLAALLHDISDHKMNGGKLNEGGNVARSILREFAYDESKIDVICSIIDGVSYKGAMVPDSMKSIEGKIVQDADRLDAIGAIGIARAFTYGGHKNRAMYIPGQDPQTHYDFESYAKAEGHTINHFYEKLLLLKNRLHTNTARKIGEERHQFMLKFLEEFYREWNTELEKDGK